MPKVRTMEQVREAEAKKAERNRKNSKLNASITKVYSIREYKYSKLVAAMEKAAKEAGKQPGRYMRIALIEKLQRDGYITESPEDIEEDVEE